MFACLSDPTKIQIIQILAAKPLSITETHKRLGQRVKYRESVFKALETLRSEKLVGRKYSEKKKAFDYFTIFKRIEINSKGELKRF